MAYRLRRNYAGVIVKKGKRDYSLTDEVGEPLTPVKAGTLLVELEEENVCSPDKQAIRPTAAFNGESDYAFSFFLFERNPEWNRCIVAKSWRNQHIAGRSAQTCKVKRHVQ